MLLHSAIQQKNTDLPNLYQGKDKSLSHYNNLADGILLNREREDNTRVLITSPGEGEGKTTVSILLAKILTMRGKKILLVEMDLRNPSYEQIFYKYLRREKNQKIEGLYNCWHDDKDLENVVVHIDGIDVLFAGRNLPESQLDPFEILSSKKVTTLLNQASAEYDFVFIDTPCIKKYRDALLMKSFADEIILIVEANKTPRRTILMAISKIEEIDGNLRGLVLNKQVNYVPEILQNLIASL